MRKNFMKKIVIFIVIFFFAFIISYIGLCYFIPGWRIKLAADTVTYFIKSIRHMMFLKSIISFLIGIAFAGIFLSVAKRKEG